MIPNHESEIDLYALGAADEEETRAVVGALIVTPQAMKDEMNTIEFLIGQLAMDVQKSTVRPEFKSAFETFRNEWRAFYQTHQGWWDRMWGATAEKIADYRRRTEEWRRALLAQGGETAIPSAGGAGSGLQAPSKVHLWLIGSAIGAWALSSVVKLRR